MIQNRVYEFRVLRKMTQEELAEKLAVTRQTIIALEKNKYVPSLEMGFKVARFFDTKIEEIFEYSE